MTYKIFSVWDIKAELFSPPFFMSTAGEAMRAFKDLVNDPQTTIGKHPEDYRLMCLGTFDNNTGDLVCSNETRQSFGFGSDYKELASTQLPLGLVKNG